MDIKGSFIPFLGAMVVCCGLFLALDAGLMNMQGLSLVFHQ